MSKFIINNEEVSVQDLKTVIVKNYKVELGSKAKAAIEKCRAYLDQRMNQTDDLIYGVNTGFGSLCDTSISKSELSQLQLNLVRSHACGTGEEAPEFIVKKMILLKAIGLSFGHSGIQLATVERLIYLYNNDITPVVYQQGSLGASGDLAPLAHIAMVLIGEGEVYYKGKKTETQEVYKTLNLKAIQLKSKEGLALLNGTQFMSAYLLHAVINGRALTAHLNLIGAMSLEAYDGRIEPFSPAVNKVRKQEGQIQVADAILKMLQGSKLTTQTKKHLQDPYSIRCIPQVHGASLDALNYATTVLEREMNAVTDNPTIFPDKDEVISAGNFHGQPLAITMDFLAIALAELGSISERRTYKLLSGERGLPPFLVKKHGLNSGFMIAQYTAASIVSQNKQLCTPASVDTIDSSNGQEDHVSMGANAATKLYKVVENTYQVAGIEMMTASQALNFRGVEKTSTGIQTVYNAYRQLVPFIETDSYMSKYMRSSKEFLKALTEQIDF